MRSTTTEPAHIAPGGARSSIRLPSNVDCPANVSVPLTQADQEAIVKLAVAEKWSMLWFGRRSQLRRECGGRSVGPLSCSHEKDIRHGRGGCFGMLRDAARVQPSTIPDIHLATRSPRGVRFGGIA